MVREVRVGLTWHPEDWLILLRGPFGRFHGNFRVVCLASAVRAVSWHANCVSSWLLDRHHLLIVWGTFEVPRGVAPEASTVLLLLGPRVALLLVVPVPVIVVGAMLILIDDREIGVVVLQGGVGA